MPQTRGLKRAWTEEEDQILSDSVHGYRGRDVDWQAVARSIPRRNNKDCRKRWAYTLERSYQKGRWTEEETALLRKGFQRYGPNWATISEVVGSRKPDQCSRRWHECVKPEINHGGWSSREEQTLRKAVKAHGHRWTEIVDRYFPDRTPITARQRFQACFNKRSDQKAKNKTHVQAEKAKHPDEAPASVDYSRDPSLKQRPYLLQDARDLGQRQLPQLMPPVETFDRTGNPSINGSSPTSSSSRRSAYEGNGASMRNDWTYSSLEDHRAFLSASDYPVQPRVIPTSLLDGRDTAGEASVASNYGNIGLDPAYARIPPIKPLASNSSISQLKQPQPRRVISGRFGIHPQSATSLFQPTIESDSNHSPWNSSFAGLDILGGMPFPRAWAPSPESETIDTKGPTFSRHAPGPKCLLSHDSYVPTSHDGSEQHATWVHRSHDMKDDHAADSAYAFYTERPKYADAANTTASDTSTIKRGGADFEGRTTRSLHALEQDLTQGVKGVAPKLDYTYQNQALCAQQ